MQPKQPFRKNILDTIKLVTDKNNKQEFKATGNKNAIEIIENKLKQFHNALLDFQGMNGIRRIKASPIIYNGAEVKQILKVVILGRDNTPYQHRKINTYMFFPDDYPTGKPIIFFENPVENGKQKKFQHINVFSSGRLCLEAIQKNYEPTMSLIEIFTQLQRIIYEEGVQSPANGALNTMKKNESKKYWDTLSQQAQLLEWQSANEIIEEKDQEEEYAF